MKKLVWALVMGLVLRGAFRVSPAEAETRPTRLDMGEGAPLMRVILETRLPEGTDAERVEMPARALRAGERYVIAGRLARVTLVAAPWDGRRWQVRYSIEPLGTAKRGHKADSGVFELDEDARTEFWTSASGPLHGLRVQLGDVSRGPALPPNEPSRWLLEL